MTVGRGSIVGLALLVGASAATVATVVFRRRATPRPPVAIIWDPSGRPLRAQNITYRCGDFVGHVRTDAQGGFSPADGCRGVPQVDGLGLTRVTDGRSSPKYQFSPLGTLRFEVGDPQGTLLRHIVTEIVVYYGIDRMVTVETREGVAELRGVPLTIPSQNIQILPRARYWRLVSLRPRIESDRVVYAIALGPNEAPRSAKHDPEGVLVRQPQIDLEGPRGRESAGNVEVCPTSPPPGTSCATATSTLSRG